MELSKPMEVMEFKYKDVVFLVKRRATAWDKFKVATSNLGEVQGNQVKYKTDELFKVLIEQFVIGWKNVTEESRAVSYSFQTLIERFPSDPQDDVFIRLGGFIVENTDIFKQDLELKNASREQANGSPKSEPSTAPVGIA